MSTEPTTNTTDVRALADAVRDGELTPEQREYLAALLINVDTAVKLAPKVREYHRDSDAAKVGYLIGTWAPVERAYAELLTGIGHPR